MTDTTPDDTTTDQTLTLDEAAVSSITIPATDANVQETLDRQSQDLPTEEPPLNESLEREKTRKWLAQALVLMLGGAIGVILIIHVVNISLLATRGKDKVDFEASKDVAGQILSPLVTLTATALGFYFGSQKDK